MARPGLLSRFFSKLVDVVYLTDLRHKTFVANHPGETILVSSAVKAIHLNGPRSVARGPEWVTAKRSLLVLTPQNLRCDEWLIPLDDITQAELVDIRQGISTGYVLKIDTATRGSYQFGMQENPAWQTQTILPLTRSSQKLAGPWWRKYVMIALIAYVIFLIAFEFIR